MSEREFDTWEPITEDDATIDAALQEANIPALMTALVHVTGDPGILRSDIRPDNSFLGDTQGGISEEQQAQIREMALQALKDYRDRGCSLPPVPDEHTIREMMNFLVGEPLPDEYIEFLQSELSLNGEDPFGQPAITAVPAERKAEFNVVVIGSGMSGILAGIRLKEAGIPYTIIEKNSNVGGTWLENTYPGCRVDSPNHTYSYSFAPKDWPQHFSAQQVLLDYFDNIASEYGIRDQIRFNTEVERAEYDETTGKWQVHVNLSHGAETLVADAVISAVGQLNRPRYPDIEGVGTFDGPEFHSSRWEHHHDLKGKRIGVVGTGASAFQFVPRVAKEAAEVTVFQRTPPWIAPRPEYHEYIPKGKHWLLNKVPYYAKWFRFLTFWRTSEGLLGYTRRDPAWDKETSVSEENDQLRAMLSEYIEQMVGDDPDLLEKCVPQYPPAGKRMLVDDGTWLTTLKQPHVNVITDSIAGINERGVETETGEQYDFDVLIYGTGFLANRFLWPMEIKGKGGVDIQEHWDGNPRAYLGVTIPNFPNLFCMYGPNTNIVVNGSIVFFSECEIRYILGCIALLLEEDCTALECKKHVHDAYNEMIDEGNLQRAWGAPNVNSWYKNEQGRVTQNWPFTLREFWERTKAPEPSDFNFV